MDVLYEAKVYADNGLPVRMRNQPSTNGKVIEQIPVGTEVDVLEDTGDWAMINDQGVVGYMMKKFLKPADESNDSSSVILVDRAKLKAVQAALVVAIGAVTELLGE